MKFAPGELIAEGYWYNVGYKLDTHLSDTVGRLLDAGYIRFEKGSEPFKSSISHQRGKYYRTDKEVTPYVPRPHLRKKPDPATYAPFPWSLDEHVQIMANSQMAVMDKVQHTLTGKTSVRFVSSYTSWGTDWYRYRLNKYRKLVKIVFETGDHYHMAFKMWEGDRRKAEHPEALRMMLLEMLLEPVFDAQGRFLRFDPMEDGPHVEQEWQRLNGLVDSWDLRDRYRHWMEEFHGREQERRAEAGEGVHAADRSTSVLRDPSPATA